MNKYYLLKTMGMIGCKKSAEETDTYGIDHPESMQGLLPEYIETSNKAIDEMDVEGYEAYARKYGHHFTNELAEHVSGMMKNTDGSSHTWSCPEVRDAMARMGYILPNSATMGDACYLANMAYADFYPQLLTDKQCIKYAYLSLVDPDGYEGQCFLRWVSDTIGKNEEIEWERYV